MSLTLEILALLTLAVMSVQDIKTRLVYWVWFPMLAMPFLFLHKIRSGGFPLIWPPVIFNIAIIIVMFSLVTVYIWITRKRLINIIDKMVGWADVLFLLSTAFYFSVPDFMVFCISSMMASLMIWIIWQAMVERKSQRIPLVGLQAIILILCLLADWQLHLVDLTDDTWLLNLMSK